MAIIKETIPVHKHFLIIDSPVPFTLVANNGTDEVYRMAGAWRIDLWKILTKDYFKQYPVFTLELVYDDTNLGGGTIEVRQSDIDLGEGIAGVNGQDVHVTNFSDMVLPENYKVTNELDSSDNRVPLEVNVSNYAQLKKNFKVVSFTSYTDIRTFLNSLEKNASTINDNDILFMDLEYKVNNIWRHICIRGNLIMFYNSNFTDLGLLNYISISSNNISFGYNRIMQNSSISLNMASSQTEVITSSMSNVTCRIGYFE